MSASAIDPEALAAWRGKVQALAILWQAIDALPPAPADRHRRILLEHAAELEAEVLAGP